MKANFKMLKKKEIINYKQTKKKHVIYFETDGVIIMVWTSFAHLSFIFEENVGI